jgi:PAS domain S-box-containing protein
MHLDSATGPDDPRRVRHSTKAYVVAAGPVLVLAALTGASARWNATPWLLACALGAAAVVHGIRAWGPDDRRFWTAVGASLACWALAAAVQVAGGPTVSAAGYELSSALYLPGYLTLTFAALLLLRNIGARRPETIDAAIGSALVAELVFPVLVSAVDHSGAAILWAALFPVWDVLLALLLLRVLFSSWSRRRSLRLLAVASLVLLVSDLVYFSGAVAASPLAARLLSVSYTLAYLLLGGAALPRSMRGVPMPAPQQEEPGGRSSRRRTLAVMALALLAMPVVYGAQRLLGHQWKELLLAPLGATIVALVVFRVGQLLRQSEELRLRAEESERLFRMVFDAAGVGISVGADGMLTRTNPALQRMLGYSEAELARLHYRDISHPDDVEIGGGAEPGIAKTFERRLIRRDGRTISVEVTLTKPTGDRYGVAVIEDITAAKQLESDLRHAQKMEAVGQLAGGVAHDFNNLMTAVTGWSAILKREIPATDERRARVDAIAAAAERAAELTRKLLAFSRRQVLRLEPLELAAVVEGFDPIVRRLLPENIVVEYDLEHGAVARVDRGELEQVVLNLALNARDAMPGGGVLAIGVHVRDDVAELVVRDTGTGMDDETRFRIFDPFFTTKPVGQGTGLGLSTVDGIVAQLGGTIDVRSAPGAGTTFTIRLPLALDVVLEAGDDAGAPEPEAAAATVLLVEDDDVVRHVTTAMLRLVGYDVTTAASGEEALALLSDGAAPDVLVSDVVMTGIDGPTLAAQARELLPDLPVLFVSGYPAESLGGTTSETVLSKPFTPHQLAEHIELVRREAAVTA